MIATVERSSALTVRRTQAMTLRIAGHSQDAVAEKLGITQQRVSQIEREWLAAREPSTEVTEQRRQMQLAGIDEVRSKLFTVLDRLTKETIPEEEWLPIVDRIDKLWAREARLVGLDLQPGLSVHVTVSAEQMAAVLWGADDAPLDVDAVELPAETGGDA